MLRTRQSGIALITVLLILSLATVAAVAMTTRQQLDIRRTTNILQIEEAYAVLLAAEEFTKVLLWYDATQTINPHTPNTTDAFGDFWHHPLLANANQEIGSFDVHDYYIEDLQGRFNVNNLLDGGQVPNQVNYARFRSLLGDVGLPEDLADRAYDWIDGNNSVYQAGAEDNEYSVLEKPYRTPNRLMASASELFRLMGVNLTGKQDYGHTNRDRRRLICAMLLDQTKFDVCQAQSNQTQQNANQNNQPQNVLMALPVRTPINVNTVVSPAIYRMIDPNLSQANALAIFNEVQGVGGGVGPGTGLGKSSAGKNPASPIFENINQFWTRLQQYQVNVPAANRVDISVDSNYFLLRVQAQSRNNPDFIVYSNTILRRIRDQGPVTVQVVHRSYGKLGEI